MHVSEQAFKNLKANLLFKCDSLVLLAPKILSSCEMRVHNLQVTFAVIKLKLRLLLFDRMDRQHLSFC